MKRRPRSVVRLIEIARLGSVAFGLAQFGPAARVADRALAALGIDEGLHHEDRMSRAGLPVGAELRDHAAQRRRTEVRHPLQPRMVPRETPLQEPLAKPVATISLSPF